jgi:hypothetical protein
LTLGGRDVTITDVATIITTVTTTLITTEAYHNLYN